MTDVSKEGVRGSWVDPRTRWQKARDAMAPMYPTVHPLFGDVDPNGWDGNGRRGSWRYDLRTVAFGYSVTTRAEQRDQGMSTEGWHLILYVGPITVDLHGSDSLEDDS